MTFKKKKFKIIAGFIFYQIKLFLKYFQFIFKPFFKVVIRSGDTRDLIKIH